MASGEVLLVGTTAAFVLTFLAYSFGSMRGRSLDALLTVVVTLGFVSAGHFALFSFSALMTTP